MLYTVRAHYTADHTGNFAHRDIIVGVPTVDRVFDLVRHYLDYAAMIDIDSAPHYLRSVEISLRAEGRDDGQ